MSERRRAERAVHAAVEVFTPRKQIPGAALVRLFEVGTVVPIAISDVSIGIDVPAVLTSHGYSLLTADLVGAFRRRPLRRNAIRAAILPERYASSP